MVSGRREARTARYPVWAQQEVLAGTKRAAFPLAESALGLCCNYDQGNCTLLEDGEPCVCVQGISYSVLCKWFRNAVLPAGCMPSGQKQGAALLRGALRQLLRILRAGLRKL